jgi:hypothetical protein
MTGCKMIQHPIGQALTPYTAAGCRAVNELVSRALFIGYSYYIIKNNFYKCQRNMENLIAIFWIRVSDHFIVLTFSAIGHKKTARL